MGRKTVDLTGQRFGKLTVLEKAEDRVSVRRSAQGNFKDFRVYAMW